MSNKKADTAARKEQEETTSSKTNKRRNAKKDKAKTKITMANTKDDDDVDDTLERCKLLKYMKLFIKPLLGDQTYEINVSEKCTIGEVKGILEIQYQVDTSQVILVHHDKQLDDIRTAVSCGVRNHSTLYMMPKMCSGPLNYKVNTRAVNRLMTVIDEDVKQAMIKMDDESGIPIKDDDIFMLTVDDKGDMRLVRITNIDKKPTKEGEDASKNEINLKTWDKESENQRTCTKMEKIRRKMKESRDRKKGKAVAAKYKMEEYSAKKTPPTTKKK